MRKQLFHIINGVRSGIPLCCVRFFIVEERKGENIAQRIHYGRTDKEFAIIDYDEAAYVQCHKCYAKNKIVKIRNNGVIFYNLLD